MRRRLAETRSEAQRLIADDRVLVRGIPTPKAATLVGADTPIELASVERRWVSRGALKLIAALEVFPVEMRGKAVLDVGASTGGFTEVALDAGAASVVALDVGTAQLHETLQRDPRVISIEKSNFRHVDPSAIGGPFPMVVVDMSFISLCTVARVLADSLTDGGDLIALVKPQFEAGKAQVGKRGVVRDQLVREQTVAQVVGCMRDAGLGAMGLIKSPIEGREGNVEYLLWLRKGATGAQLEVPA